MRFICRIVAGVPESIMRASAVHIASRLSDAGHVAWFAGGCVRDRLLGFEPKDYDIATDATPEEVLQVFPRARTVGAHFGVVLVHHKGQDFEIATFREDGEYLDGRRPEGVIFSSPEGDARRRDFTVNGLYEKPESGEIVDFVGGRADLEAGILRAIGSPEERFAEDHLRMLRAVRFATRFGFEIDPATWESVRRNSSHLSRISPERIRAEFDKILLGPERVRGFDLLVESGLMRSVIPEIYDLQGCQQPPEFHPEGDVFTHVRLMLSHARADACLNILLSVLLHDIAKPATQVWSDEKGRFTFNGHAEAGAEMAERVLRRLRYPNAVIEAVVASVAHHMKFLDAEQMRRSTLRRFMGRDRFEEELELHRLDALGSNGDLSRHSFITSELEAFQNEPVVPAPLLNGRDLIERGFASGPELGQVLDELQTLQLEGELTDREAALEWLKSQ